VPHVSATSSSATLCAHIMQCIHEAVRVCVCVCVCCVCVCVCVWLCVVCARIFTARGASCCSHIKHGQLLMHQCGVCVRVRVCWLRAVCEHPVRIFIACSASCFCHIGHRWIPEHLCGRVWCMNTLLALTMHAVPFVTTTLPQQENIYPSVPSNTQTLSSIPSSTGCSAST
jgi:hypothetical protein